MPHHLTLQPGNNNSKNTKNYSYYKNQWKSVSSAIMKLTRLFPVHHFVSVCETKQMKDSIGLIIQSDIFLSMTVALPGYKLLKNFTELHLFHMHLNSCSDCGFLVMEKLWLWKIYMPEVKQSSQLIMVIGGLQKVSVYQCHPELHAKLACCPCGRFQLQNSFSIFWTLCAPSFCSFCVHGTNLFDLSTCL